MGNNFVESYILISKVVVIITETIIYLIELYIEFEFIFKFVKESKDVDFSKFVFVVRFFKFNIIKSIIIMYYIFSIFVKFVIIS